jgi:hypothetical protein
MKELVSDIIKAISLLINTLVACVKLKDVLSEYRTYGVLGAYISRVVI